MKTQTAANGDLTTITDAQTKTFDFSYSNIKVRGPNKNGVHYDCVDFVRSRNNTVSYQIYPVHSFSNDKDCYLVQSTATSVPKNFVNIIITFNDYVCNYTYGYIRMVYTSQYVDNGTMSVNDVALIKNVPSNPNISTTYSEDMEWNVSNKVGVNKDGVVAEVGGGVSYSKSKSWSVSEYSLVNISMRDYIASDQWYTDTQTPDNGATHYVGALLVFCEGVNAKSAARNQMQYDADWIWKIGKDYWKNHSNIKMNIKFEAQDGACFGWCQV